MYFTPVCPSIPFINIGLFKYLANHPLIVNPLVVHPITGQPIEIANYRQKDGFSSLPGLLCSIYPANSNNLNDSSPTSLNVSAILKNDNLSSSGYQEIIYHFICKFTYNLEVAFDDLTKSEDLNIIRVPKEAIVYNSQINTTLKNNTKDINLYIDIPNFIIGSYLELSRLAFLDREYQMNTFNIPGIKSIEVLHYNMPTQEWEKSTNIIANYGYLYLRLIGFVDKGWRDKLRTPLKDIKISLEDYISNEEVDFDI